MHKKINNCFILNLIIRNRCCSINIPSKARTLLAFATFFFHAVLDCKLWICHPARRGEALLQTRTVIIPARLVLRRKFEFVFDPEITTCADILLVSYLFLGGSFAFKLYAIHQQFWEHLKFQKFMDQHNFEMIHFKCTIPELRCTIPVLLCYKCRFMVWLWNLKFMLQNEGLDGKKKQYAT